MSHVACCFLPTPTGSKTADATWKRYTDWQIEKTVTPDSITMLDGATHDVEYTVTATPTTRGAYRVSRTITFRDPYNYGWSAAAVADTMQFTGNATQFSLAWDGPGGNADTMCCSDPNLGDVILVQLSVHRAGHVPSCGAKEATSLSCTYDATLPREFVTGYNQASITRNKKRYAADGTPSNCGTMTYDSNQAALR